MLNAQLSQSVVTIHYNYLHIKGLKYHPRDCCAGKKQESIDSALFNKFDMTG